VGGFDGFGEGVDGGVKTLVFTTGKDDLDWSFGINESRKIFKDSIGTFAAGNDQESEDVGVEF